MEKEKLQKQIFKYISKIEYNESINNTCTRLSVFLMQDPKVIRNEITWLEYEGLVTYIYVQYKGHSYKTIRVTDRGLRYYG